MHRINTLCLKKFWTPVICDTPVHRETKNKTEAKTAIANRLACGSFQLHTRY